jgi:hypothetical protein
MTREQNTGGATPSLDLLRDDHRLTLEQAAALTGYRSASTLRTAAREGRLRTERMSARVQWTTAGALRDYLAGQSARGFARGHVRGTQRTQTDR